jgi:hypothetical protein
MNHDNLHNYTDYRNLANNQIPEKKKITMIPTTHGLVSLDDLVKSFENVKLQENELLKELLKKSVRSKNDNQIILSANCNK